jgi:quercetin dioxygenase-like cupin family protein
MNNCVEFVAGKDCEEAFEGYYVIERGIKRRIKHDVLGISVHDAELVKGIQEGHKHSTLHEAIMLLEGKIRACWWDDCGNLASESLSTHGDMVVFPPNINHTLIVEEDSRIIVVKFRPNDDRDEWIKASECPANLDKLRREMLKAEEENSEILQRALEAVRSQNAE